MAFGLSKANTGFANTTVSNTSIPFSLTGLNVSTFNQAFAAQYAITSSGSQTIDLTSLTNLVSESFSFGHALTIIVTTTGGQITLSPGASNPLTWFFGGTSPTITITAGGMFCYSEPVTGPGTVVSSSHKTLTLTNNGGTTSTVTIGILGSTT